MKENIPQKLLLNTGLLVLFLAILIIPIGSMGITRLETQDVLSSSDEKIVDTDQDSDQKPENVPDKNTYPTPANIDILESTSTENLYDYENPFKDYDLDNEESDVKNEETVNEEFRTAPPYY